MAGAAENRVTVWDAASGAKQWEVFGGQGDMGKLLFSTSVSYSPDGRTLAVAAQDDVTAGGTAAGEALLDSRTGRLVRTLLGSGEPVNGVAVSPDGKHVAGVTGAFESEHPEVFLWDMATGEAVWNSRADAGPLFSVAYAPDGRTLAVGGRAPDGASVTLWDAASGALVRTFPQGETALSVAYAPDGKTLVSGGLNGTLKVWDPASGALRASLPGARSPLGVFSVAVAPDGRHIAAASDEGTVKLIEMRK
jgi:WD40 repeat protein